MAFSSSFSRPPGDWTWSPRAVVAGRPDCTTDRGKQRLLVHGLPEVPGRAGLFEATPGRVVVVGRNEDDRDLHPVGGQALLEVEPAAVEMDVEDEADRSTAGQRVEKVAGGKEARDGVAVRQDQAMERPEDRGGVVDAHP